MKKISKPSKQELEALISIGKSYREIYEHFGFSDATLDRLFKKYGLSTRVKTPLKNDLQILIDQKLNVYDIAKQYNVHWSTVYGWLKTHSIKNVYTIAYCKKTDRRPDKKILLESINGSSIDEVAKKFDVNYKMVASWFKYYGINTICASHGADRVEFSEKQLNIINGTLLGDGSLSICSGKRNSSFAFCQAIKNEEYVRYIHDSLKPFSIQIVYEKRRKPKRINGKINHDINNWDGEYVYNVTSYTFSHPVLKQLREKWYSCPYKSRGTKIVPRDLVLNDEVLAYWFCDDGCNYPHKNRALINTDGFSIEDVDFLIGQLKSMSIDCKMYFKNKKPQIGIRKNGYRPFIDRIYPFVKPIFCMNYKINKEHVNAD